MAQKPYKADIEYVQQYYTYGSEAKVIELKPVYREEKPKVPKAPREQVRTIHIDPVGLCGMLVAVVMLVAMLAGIIQFNVACEDYEIMEHYLSALQEENVFLTQQYKASYELETVEETALALGMIPVDQAQTLTMRVTVPEREPDPTLWDDIVWFITGLFE